MSSSTNIKSSFNIYFIIYAILAIAIVFGGTNKMYGENLMIQAVFFFIAASAIFSFMVYAGLEQISLSCQMLRFHGHLLSIHALTI